VKQKIKQKLYCYVDETGQDAGSDFFIVVAVISDRKQDPLRQELLKIESLIKIGSLKWQKTRFARNIKYLKLILQKKIGKIYFSHYRKPFPYFAPIIKLLEKSILNEIRKEYKVIVYVDGIDKQKAGELTNALRVSNIKLEQVRSARDESEPLIRLADRWAGCIRKAFLNWKEAKKIFEQAKKEQYLQEIKK